MNKAVFLDRDGTLIEEVNYLKKKEEISIYPETIKALRNFKKSGYLNIIITNQSGIARGYFSEDDLDAVHIELRKMLTADGQELIEDIYYSPFHIDGIIEKCIDNKIIPDFFAGNIYEASLYILNSN